MNPELQQGMRAVFDAVAAKQLREMRANPQRFSLDDVPSGKENQLFQIGEKVVSTGTGTYKAGVEMEIESAYEQNGY